MRASGGNRTRDLFLTKEARYRYATEAPVHLSGDQVTRAQTHYISGRISYKMVLIVPDCKNEYYS